MENKMESTSGQEIKMETTVLSWGSMQDVMGVDRSFFLHEQKTGENATLILTRGF